MGRSERDFEVRKNLLDLSLPLLKFLKKLIKLKIKEEKGLLMRLRQ